MKPDQTLGAVSSGFIVFASVIKLFWNAFEYTVKPVLSGHSKIDKTKVVMENDS